MNKFIKKLCIISVCVLSLLNLSACGNNSNYSQSSSNQASSESNTPHHHFLTNKIFAERANRLNKKDTKNNPYIQSIKYRDKAFMVTLRPKYQKIFAQANKDSIKESSNAANELESPKLSPVDNQAISLSKKLSHILNPQFSHLVQVNVKYYTTDVAEAKTTYYYQGMHERASQGFSRETFEAIPN